MKKLYALILTALFAVSAFTVSAEDAPITYTNGIQIAENEINYVSEYTLIGSPKEYDGKKIRVVGIFKIENDKCLLYSSTESSNMKITKNALWCNINAYNLKNNSAKLQKLDGKFVTVEGVFNGLNTGQTKYYSGAIENISKIQEWK